MYSVQYVNWLNLCMYSTYVRKYTISMYHTYIPLSDGVPDFVLAMTVPLVVVLSLYLAVTVMVYSVSATKFVRFLVWGGEASRI